MTVFSKIINVVLPTGLVCEERSGLNPAFEITFATDGEVPFPQVILHTPSGERPFNGEAIAPVSSGPRETTFEVSVPAGLFGAGEVRVQVEGCRTADWRRAGGGDWIKEFRTLIAGRASRIARASAGPDAGQIKIHFGIHKHMHQPYYDAVDRFRWDGEKDGIFGSRGGNYTTFVADAVRRYAAGGLPHAGLSTSWSGSLIEQLDRCARDGLCGGRFSGWHGALREIARERTTLGNPRCDFSAFGFYHPLMALIPDRDIVRQIERHRRIIREAFGVEASKVMFPPETAFHVRMIPALRKAGVEAVIYDSIHRYRSCRDYPHAGPNEGMLPPDPAEQVNPPVDDWLQLSGVWAGSKISPSLLRPEWIEYVDPDGAAYRIIGVPAERYIGNEDARGGFGALQYPNVFGQLWDAIAAGGSFDPKHPPFLVLHSDGDNHGGGADSYYHHNTERLVEWLREDPRFELTSILDYLDRFPPDPAKAVHIEPGSWSGADNGDPQFMKWFSRYDQPYSPDLNSWAVLTAYQNAVHTLEDAEPGHPDLEEATRLLLTAETSCYWYWTGQTEWDRQVTNAADAGWSRLSGAIDALVSGRRDTTPPTIFAPWITPENPGGKKWGRGGLVDAPREGTVHTFVHDVSGLAEVTLVLRAGSTETRIPMRNNGAYPTETGARVRADHLTADLPVGIGGVRYFIEAVDVRGNRARGALERVWLA